MILFLGRTGHYTECDHYVGGTRPRVDCTYFLDLSQWEFYHGNLSSLSLRKKASWDGRPLPFSTPVSSSQSMLWCLWFCDQFLCRWWLYWHFFLFRWWPPVTNLTFIVILVDCAVELRKKKKKRVLYLYWCIYFFFCLFQTTSPAGKSINSATQNTADALCLLALPVQ